MPQTTLVKDRYFVPMISAAAIKDRLKVLGEQISRDYADCVPLFLSVLNGSFVFAADIMRHVAIPSQISFVKYASYEGIGTTGKVSQLLGINEDITHRRVIILEDIVDTGNTMSHLLPYVLEAGAKDVQIASLLTKPEALQHPIAVKYVGFEIPNRFVVGYGLDYDGYGRNLDGIYVLHD
jgi:hypoxanthine phosphoribosyltransferase